MFRGHSHAHSFTHYLWLLLYLYTYINGELVILPKTFPIWPFNFTSVLSSRTFHDDGTVPSTIYGYLYLNSSKLIKIKDVFLKLL